MEDCAYPSAAQTSRLNMKADASAETMAAFVPLSPAKPTLVPARTLQEGEYAVEPDGDGEVCTRGRSPHKNLYY
jgi:hypothetical protein